MENSVSKIHDRGTHDRHILITCLLLLFLIVVLRTAWLSDDAYITFRTIDNYVNGYGLRWNVEERVQAYTHPLWLFFLLFPYYVTGEIYYTAMLLSVLLSVLTLWVFCTHLAKDAMHALIGALILVFSKAFIDYSTSGLENPLTHLLLAGFLVLYYRQAELPDSNQEKHLEQLSLLAFLAALGILNRMDTALIFAPPLLYVMSKHAMQWSTRPVDWKVWGKIFQKVLLGFLPFILWELFSLLYYGFLFPNTAYAKLNTGVHSWELLEQGIYYLQNSLNWDPITLFSITCFLLFPLLLRPRKISSLAVGIGIMLYLVYIVKIGGDFMSGRFLTAPLLCAVTIFAQTPLKPIKQGIPLLLIVLGLGLTAPRPTIQNDDSYEAGYDHRRVNDERGFYYQATGLLRNNRENSLPEYEWVERGKTSGRNTQQHIDITASIGFWGFYAGPQTHIIDNNALSEPLLARLPIMTAMGRWRPGHFWRYLPPGYVETLSSRKNMIQDPDLALYWEKLSLVTQGNLFSWERFREIWNLNTNKYDRLIFNYICRNHYLPPDKYPEPKPLGAAWDTAGNYLINKYGIGFKLAEPVPPGTGFEASLNEGHIYTMVYYREGQEVARQSLDVPEAPQEGLFMYQAQFPDAIVRQHFDMVRFFPAESGGRYSIGHFRTIPPQTVP